jgi:hypothetical protein
MAAAGRCADAVATGLCADLATAKEIVSAKQQARQKVEKHFRIPRNSCALK